MEQPKISIITPNYNGARYLEETIKSVLDQNYPNLEYIIIDGASTDGSVEIIERYQERLAYWVSEPDGGLYEAIQKGFDKSSGEIMAWINSDDKYHPNSFSTAAEIFSNLPRVNWLVGAATVFDERGRTVAVAESKSFTKYDFYGGNYRWIQQESTFWRRSLWDSAGSYVAKSKKLAGDFELWLRFFRHENLYVTDALIGGFRRRSKDQLSLEHMDKYILEVEQSLANEDIPAGVKRNASIYACLMRLTSLINRIAAEVSRRIMNKCDRVLRIERRRIMFDRINQRYCLSKR